MAESGTTVAHQAVAGWAKEPRPCGVMSRHEDTTDFAPVAARLADWVIAQRGYDALSCLVALERAGHPSDAIADGVIPQAARFLGQAWVEDRLDFAAVTIGAARLQHLLGLLVDQCAGADPTAPRVLLISPEGDDHTLGWKLTGLQLLRRGIAVMAVPDGDASTAALARDGVDLVMVSASHPAGLRLAECIAPRLGLDGPPVVAGGMVIGREGVTKPKGLAAVTNDLPWAVSLAWRRAKARRSVA